MQRSNEAQVEFVAETTNYDPSMFVWLDETGCGKWNAIRVYGYALRALVPRSYSFKCLGKIYTANSINVNGWIGRSFITEGNLNRWIGRSFITEGNVNGDGFLDYVRHSLLPTLMSFIGLNPKSIVIMDNASIHHIDEVIATFTAVGVGHWCGFWHHTVQI